MEIIEFFIELLRDPRQFIADWINTLGPIWVYAPLFLIIFVETGLVIMPFLPGDSLLFTAGIFAADGGGLNLAVLIILLSIAAILGNTSNYWIGRKIGQAIIDGGRVKALTPERIEKTQAMLDKYGLLAIVLTRFFPFIRTFAPFIAGIGNMHFARFTLFNVMGGVLWVSLFTLLGYFFGGIPFVQDHFSLVILAILLVSLLPTIIGLIRARFSSVKKKRQKAEAATAAEAPAEGKKLTSDTSADQKAATKVVSPGMEKAGSSLRGDADEASKVSSGSFTEAGKTVSISTEEDA